MAKIGLDFPQNAIIGSTPSESTGRHDILLKAKRGDLIYVPENYVCVASNGSVCGVIYETTKLKPSLFTNVKIPLFRDRYLVFEYIHTGYSASLIASDREFKLSSGEKAKMSFKINYSVRLRDPKKVKDLSEFCSAYVPDNDGCQLSIEKLHNNILSLIEKFLSDKAASGKEWRHQMYDENNKVKPIPSAQVDVEFEIQALVKDLFTKYGYDCTSIFGDFKNIDIV